MSRKERRAWKRDNAVWVGAARSAISELEVAATMIRSGHYDYGRDYVKWARKDIRFARWRCVYPYAATGGMMAAWREERLTGRKQNQRSAERVAPDNHPTCPRCLELLEPGSRHCAECGCAVTIGSAPVHSSVEGGDK